jgi:CheY-like chemotaxis protein
MNSGPDRPELIDRAPQATTASQPGKVLIVDDHEVNRRLFAAYCDLLNLGCEFAANGEEAVAAVQKSPFDLVLMDIQMPVMNGIEATRAIRGLAGPAARVPIIAVTSDADSQDRETYLASGMRDVVAKPISVGRLFSAINDVLGLAQGERRSWAARDSV